MQFPLKPPLLSPVEETTDLGEWNELFVFPVGIYYNSASPISRPEELYWSFGKLAKDVEGGSPWDTNVDVWACMYVCMYVLVILIHGCAMN